MYSCFCQDCNKVVGEFNKKNEIVLCPKCQGIFLIFIEKNKDIKEIFTVKNTEKEEEDDDNQLQKILNDYFTFSGNI